MKLSDPVLHEVLTEWRAWQTLVDHLLPPGADARTANPLDVHAAIEDLPIERLGRLSHLMIGLSYADTLEEASSLITDLRVMACEGRRPRYAAEAGMSFQDFEEVLR